MLMAQALIDPGDNFVIVAPIWPNIAAVVSIMGGEPRLVSLDPTPQGGWRLDLDKIKAACDGRTKGIFVNSPANPTGWTCSADEIAALVALPGSAGFGSSPTRSTAASSTATRRRRLSRAAEPEDRLIVINSFSKSWAMTGWRLGWIVIPTDLLPTIEKLVEFNTSGSPTFLQHAAIAAIRDGEPFIRGFVARCRDAREAASRRCKAAGAVEVARPDGAF